VCVCVCVCVCRGAGLRGSRVGGGALAPGFDYQVHNDLTGTMFCL
jgi:hypothetical protein